jgi:2-oxoglutarate dehydrogenase E1 component
MVVHDVPSGNRIRPTVPDTPDLFEIINSPLSEYGVLGFEYGHSLRKPDALTIWEAQFGDFLNGAQIVVDQYIVSAEAKWRLKSGLVVLLPHGLEGQGPDHSSARIERLTQMAAGGNIIIANPSTPANLFHLLRRQIHAPWRKPLFVIAPKSLLRAKAAVSTLEEMGPGRSFLPLIAEGGRSKAVKRLVICSGKIAYALEQARAEAGRDSSVRILRVEQIYPLPLLGIQTAIAESPGAELFWLQEEPANQGAWPFVSQRLAEIGITSIRLVARPSLPVTAAGSVERHEREQAGLLAAALGI